MVEARQEGRVGKRTGRVEASTGEGTGEERKKGKRGSPRVLEPSSSVGCI